MGTEPSVKTLSSFLAWRSLSFRLHRRAADGCTPEVSLRVSHALVLKAVKRLVELLLRKLLPEARFPRALRVRPQRFLPPTHVMPSPKLVSHRAIYSYWGKSHRLVQPDTGLIGKCYSGEGVTVALRSQEP